ncbi:MAG: hypothetical protein WA857_08700 [Candidatus Acidiferrum sp.]
MSLTLRLSADLALASVCRAFSERPAPSPILQLSAEDFFGLSNAPHSENGEQATEKFLRSLAEAPGRRSPIVWIGGSEPLDFSEVARFSNTLAASGRNVFLETSGASPKPRLHEFQPSPTFYFVIRFNASVLSDAQRQQSEPAYRIGLEAVRMARLAGFFTCANLVLHAGTPANALERLHSEIRKLDLDGTLITPATFTPELQQQVRDARRRLLSRRCVLLSSFLDHAAPLVRSQASQTLERQPIPESQSRRVGEGAEAG